jgi:hypothetical protein
MAAGLYVSLAARLIHINANRRRLPNAAFHAEGMALRAFAGPSRCRSRPESAGAHSALFPGLDPTESAAELLAKAARIRRHAWTFAGDPAEKRLEQIADELEAKAREAARARI